MEAGYFITQTDLDKILNGLCTKVIDEVVKMKLSESPITKEQAAEYLRITYRTFDEKVKSGVIPSSLLHRIDGTVLLYKSELETYVKSL